jgi:hypothetical protein
MPAAAAARRIVRAVARRRRDVVVTGHGKAIVFLARHFPRLMAYLARRTSGSRARSREHAAAAPGGSSGPR